MLNVALALAAAFAFWHGAPPTCSAAHPLNPVIATPAQLPPSLLGRVNRKRHPCRIFYAARIRRQRTLCWTMKHEWGHLRGHPHSAAHGTIMLPKLVLPPRRRYCRARVS